MTPDGVLYATDNRLGELVTLDPATGAITATVGPFVNTIGLEGLAAHPFTGELWGVYQQFLFRVDRATGLATPIPISFSGRWAGLTFDRTGTWLYAAEFDRGEIIRIDPVTGAWSLQGLVNAGQTGGPLGLANDPHRDVLYVTEWWGGQDARLVEFSLQTGGVTPIAVLTGYIQVEGLTEVEFELGVSYCGPGVPNSTSSSGRMRASGSLFVSDDDVRLEAQDLPPNALGFFLTSRSRGHLPQPPGSVGVFCLSGQIGRFVGPGQVRNSGMAGSFDLVLQLAQQPTPSGFVSVLPGETWHFQAWHRDTVAGSVTSNFTDGYSITFR